jgi:hypothetical protein
MAKPVGKREQWTTGSAGKTRAFFKRLQRRTRRRILNQEADRRAQREPTPSAEPREPS